MEGEWFVIGLLVGIPVGLIAGWLIAQLFGSQGQQRSYGVMFERDEKGLIRAILPVPG